jgi:hypothetical protein
MRLELTIDLDAVSSDPADEAGRILRYWGGAMKQLDLGQPLEQPLMDSAYRPVGTLRVVE